MRDTKGFSLLEVLVAFTLLALVLGVVYEVFGRSAQAARLGDEYGRAVIIAQNLLAETQVWRPLPLGEERGQTADGYRWLRRVGAAGGAPAPGAHSLREVAVEVRWEGPAQDRMVALRTLRLVPEP